MTLLDAPVFNEARDRRNQKILWSSLGSIAVLIIGFWLVAGRPIDFPWHWNAHLQGRLTINAFFKAVEKDDMVGAYGIWVHDKSWQLHPQKYDGYPFDRFQKDWSPHSPDNEYGIISSHRLAATRMIGNQLMTGTFINGRKSKAINLDFDPSDHTLTFTPDDKQFLEGPGGIS
jgi:hypothetical protein